MLFGRYYFSPLNTFIRKGKDPDPYPRLMDPVGPKHAGPADPFPDPDPPDRWPDTPYHYEKQIGI